MITLLKKRTNKKGLSDVVATVLIVLLTLAAVAVIWTFIRPLFTTTGAQIDAQGQCLLSEIRPTVCTLTATTAIVTAQFVKGDDPIKLKIVVQDSNGNRDVTGPLNGPSTILGTIPNTVTLDKVVNIAANKPIIAKVAPVVKDSNGNDYVCEEGTVIVTCA
ncbi:MAG: hypothetical protein Q7S74_04815 [Nanoarchaeota archaeon]|nr:hypothetical protein [Nanoarchaeota archaeon]